MSAISETVASHRIADALRTEILDGLLAPGTRIRQEDLAERFGASRIPVREAIRMLNADGLVTIVSNSGAWVSRLTLEECMEAYAIRERLDPLLLRSSLPQLSTPDVDRLSELADEMQANTDVDVFMRLDREFHLLSYDGASHAGYLWEVVHRLWNTTQHYRRAYAGLVGVGLQVTHMEHHLLVDCLRRNDSEDAESVLTTHIRRTRLELVHHPEIFA